MKKTLLLIALFLTLIIGSFIWFIATWEAEKEQPIGMRTPTHMQRAIT
ncbi:hypothetical protein ACJ5NV_14120 [Loktanella agnita]